MKPPSGEFLPPSSHPAPPVPPPPRNPEQPVLRLRVGFELVYELPYAAPMLFVVEPQERPGQRLLASHRSVSPSLPPEAMTTYTDLYGNRVWRLLAPAGELRVTHDVLVEVPSHTDPVLPDLRKLRVEDLPSDTLAFLLPSRYVDSDRLSAEAWERFGHIQGGWAQVQAVCDHLKASVVYGAGSDSSTTAQEAYVSGHAVCRDFAHMGVAFCRALNIPARYVCGYLPDIDVPADWRPMDFHAWFEAWVDGEWRTFDARHNYPRVGRVLIAQGRDASDTAFSTAFGTANLRHMRVWADEVPYDMLLPQRPPAERQTISNSGDLVGPDGVKIEE